MNLARVSKLSVLLCAIATILMTSSAFAATVKTRQLTPGEKGKMSGLIVSRDGDLVRVRDKKSHEVITVSIGDATQIERKNHKLPFYRHTDMDVAALLGDVEGLRALPFKWTAEARRSPSRRTTSRSR